MGVRTGLFCSDGFSSLTRIYNQDSYYPQLRPSVPEWSLNSYSLQCFRKIPPWPEPCEAFYRRPISAGYLAWRIE